MRKRRHWAKLLTQYHTAGEWWRQNSKAAILAPRSQQLYSTTAHSLQPIETGLLSAPSCSSETFQQVHQWLLPCQHKGPSVFILSIMQYPIKVKTFLFCYTSFSLVVPSGGYSLLGVPRGLTLPLARKAGRREKRSKCSSQPIRT